ncbi:hypothetical protein [Microbacterium sp.]|uniref:hypothetical protein n=1 Tax=Microbacterium sp. TaxID=51671 RepID=UPI003C7903D8
MTPSTAELLENAKLLPREERAELAESLLATLGAADSYGSARHESLRLAVQSGIDSYDVGRYEVVHADGLREYLREIGREAAEIVDSQRV